MGISLGWTLGFGTSEAFCAQSVTLAWNANTETNLAGYRLYYGEGSRSYSGQVQVGAPLTSATVTNLQAGRTYFFAVTAYTRDGLESDYSDEVRYSVPSSGGVTPTPVVTESLVVSGEAPPELLPFPAETEEIVQMGGDESGEVESTVVIDSSSSAGPRLAIIPVGQPPVAYFLRFEAPANKDCELQVSNDLQSWRGLIPFRVGSASRQLEFTDLEVNQARRYYRLLIQ